MDHMNLSSVGTEPTHQPMQPMEQLSPLPPPIDALSYWKAGTHEVKTFRGHSQGVWSVGYSPDGLTLASGGADRHLRL